MRPGPHRTAPVSLRLYPADMDRVRRLAVAEATTVTAIIRHAINAHLSEVA